LFDLLRAMDESATGSLSADAHWLPWNVAHAVPTAAIARMTAVVASSTR